MARTFLFKFEELPLTILNGIEAAFINGAADIEYHNGGFWSAQQIYVEGFGERIAGKRQWPLIPASDALASVIAEQLEIYWIEKVQDAVNEQIAEDRADAADIAADMRRDMMMERA